jgi:hypothetical protein
MRDNDARGGPGAMEGLVLRALVRMLVDKGVLSPDDVRALLVEAASGLDVIGGELTPEAARSIAAEDWAPLFLKR